MGILGSPMGDGSFQNLKILVVEDDSPMRSFLRAVLGDRGTGKYAEAKDGEEALKVLPAFTPDVVVSDWIMAPMDGLELLRHFRKGAGDVSPFVPFIMVAWRGDKHWRDMAADAGVTEFLEKPVLARGLYQAISNAARVPSPFVRSRDFFGLDRRRHRDDYPGANKRVSPPVLVSPASNEESPPPFWKKWAGVGSLF